MAKTKQKVQTKTFTSLVDELKIGDFLTESSQYIVKDIDKNKDVITLIHLQSKQLVTIDKDYINEFIQSADIYNEEIKVGKEDKLWTKSQIDAAKKKNEFENKTEPNVGDVKVPGIRSIWMSISTNQGFTVCFTKSNTMMTKSQYELQVQKKVIELQNTMKDVAISDLPNMLAQMVISLSENPITRELKGEDRVLRGYKVQFESTTGHYDCVDIDITTDMNIRPVNINTIKYLIVNNKKYIVE